MDFISFIVPAHNEAFEITGTLKSIFDAANTVGEPFEVIVANDASTDETKRLAQKVGAHVVDVNLRKISAVRNAGARQAQGNILFFLDADTRLSQKVLEAALQALRQGAVGGGASVQFAEPVSFGVRLAFLVFSIVYGRILHWAAGCCIFARRDAFQRIGGFDEMLYAGEEIGLSIALKRQGHFVILHETVTTSGRKLRLYSPWSILPFGWRFLRQGPAMLRQREGLELWYDGRREK